jgi:hypothetical protein
MEFAQRVLDFFLDSRWGNFLGLAGLFFAGYTWRRPRTGKALSYVYDSNLLLGHKGADLPPEINVSYAGVNIPRLSRATVALWNSGHASISGSAIVADDPLRIHLCPEGQVLSARVVSQTRPNIIKVAISRAADGTFPVTFSFLDTKDSAVIEILHTAEEGRPHLVGTIQDLPDGPTNRGRTNISEYLKNSSQTLRQRLFGSTFWGAVAGITTGVGLSAVGAWTAYRVRSGGPEDSQPLSLGVAVLGVAGVALTVSTYKSLRRRFPVKRLVSNGN